MYVYIGTLACFWTSGGRAEDKTLLFAYSTMEGIFLNRSTIACTYCFVIIVLVLCFVASFISLLTPLRGYPTVNGQKCRVFCRGQGPNRYLINFLLFDPSPFFFNLIRQPWLLQPQKPVVKLLGRSIRPIPGGESPWPTRKGQNSSISPKNCLFRKEAFTAS